MDKSLYHSGAKTNYGTLTLSQSQSKLYSENGIHFDSKKNTVSLVDTTEEAISSLSVQNVNYVVKEWVGPWWKGACFRKIRSKTVLRDISLHVKSAEITAILGNSGTSH
jgi:ABC-type glutathione transport system ATPase component